MSLISPLIHIIRRMGNEFSSPPHHKEVHMDHIKMLIYGFIGIGVVVSVIALLVKMLGIARYG